MDFLHSLLCPVDRVMQKGSQWKQKFQHEKASHEMTKSSQCQNCFKILAHPRAQCAANEVVRHSCGKKGHHQRVIKSRKQGSKKRMIAFSEEQYKSRMIDIQVMNRNVKFKIHCCLC